MNLTVYLGANEGNDPAFKKDAQEYCLAQIRKCDSIMNKIKTIQVAKRTAS